MADFAAQYAQAGYAHLLQTTRGTYISDGQFNPFKQERSDGYDTVSWVVSQPWSNGDVGAQAYLGVTTHGYPNLFQIYGPNTNNGSILYMLECQVDYAMRQIQRMHDEGLVWMDVRADAMAAYNEELQRDISNKRPRRTYS